MGLFAAVLLALLAASAAATIQYFSLRRLSPFASRRLRPHFKSAVLLCLALIAIHLSEAFMYAVAYSVLALDFGAGSLSGLRSLSWFEYLYFSAETFTTLGYGDMAPIGPERLIASIECIQGVMLLAWSGGFVFGWAQAPAMESARLKHAEANIEPTPLAAQRRLHRARMRAQAKV